MTADELLKQGDLDRARAALVETVRRSPGDQPARMFLWQLMALSGEWDKAAAQLRSLASVSPEAQMLATVYHQAIEAEKVRAAAFAGQGGFSALTAPSPWMEDLLASLDAAAKGDAETAETRRDAAFAAAPDTAGEADGRPFDWIADADARFGPTFEAVLYGRWGLIAFESVESIKIEGPNDLRDLVWLPVQIRFRSGQSSAALLPARYPGTEAAPESSLRLARETRWRDGPAGQTGLGQRLWTLSDGDDVGLLSLDRVTFT